MEDGILTDGKGRTVNFKNVVLVMTSNVGSKRILQVAKDRVNKANGSVNGVNGTNGATKKTPSPSASMEPPKPEEVLKKLQSSPQAMSLMMEASRDSEIMSAMQTAMGGSPADLMKLAQKSPKVADFLTRLWDALDMDESKSSMATSTATKSDKPAESSSGLVESTLDSWSKASAGNEFTSGLVNQLKGMLPKTNGDHQANGSTTASLPAEENNSEAVDEYNEMSDVVKEELEDVIKPELLNRIDEIIVFAPLSGTDLTSIAQLIVDQTAKRAEKERNVSIKIGPSLLQKIVDDGSSNAAQFGARPMRRAVQRYFEDTVSDAIIRGFVQDFDDVTVDLAENSDGEWVDITRKSDGQKILSRVEDANGGIGNTGTKSLGAKARRDELKTESVSA